MMGDSLNNSPSSIRKSKEKTKVGHRRITNEGTVTYKKKTTSEIQTAVQLGIRVSVTLSHEKVKRDMLLKDFGVVETMSFPKMGSKETPPHDINDFKFKTFAPIAFRYFRDFFQVNVHEYLDSLCHKDLRELSNAGASGSIFYITNDDEFIIKTVQHKEASFLQKLLPEYYINLIQHPRTLLPKFYGLYCYQTMGKNIRFVVMNNLLPSITIHEKYDLKGSTHKRLASQSEKAKKSPTLKDIDFRDGHPDGLFLEVETYEALLNTIQRDCRVLESFSIMDYSLLLGIHNLDKSQDSKLLLSPNSLKSLKDGVLSSDIHLGPRASSSFDTSTNKSDRARTLNKTFSGASDFPVASDTMSTGMSSQKSHQRLNTFKLSAFEEEFTDMGQQDSKNDSRQKHSKEVGCQQTSQLDASYFVHKDVDKRSKITDSTAAKSLEAKTCASVACDAVHDRPAAKSMRPRSQNDRSLSANSFSEPYFTPAAIDCSSNTQQQQNQNNVSDKTQQRSPFTRSDSKCRSTKRIAAYSTVLESIHAPYELMDLQNSDQEVIPSGGIPARNKTGDRIILFMGIIDILQSYEIGKKMEHNLKSIFLDPESISVCNPTFYAQRFQDFFANLVFKKIPSSMKHHPSKLKKNTSELAKVVTNSSSNATQSSSGITSSNRLSGTLEPDSEYVKEMEHYIMRSNTSTST